METLPTIGPKKDGLYTAIVKDLCTKDIVGYAIGDRITKDLVISALKMAISIERPKHGLIFHSDRGSQVRQEVA